MDKDPEKIAYGKISNPQLMVFWIILGVLSLILLYYAYEMLFIYF
jgi:hypothetical protein